MKPENSYGQMADYISIMKVFDSLEKNGIHPFLVENKKEAAKKVLELIPHHEEVMNMTSVTLTELGLDEIINISADYISIRRLIGKEGTSQIEKKRLGSAHEWAIGSVHAVTESGQLMIASATGSQLPSYAYGANNLIWIVGIQKIVKDLDEGFRRIKEYVFPLENERAMRTYGVGSGINKILIVNKEVVPGRIHVIFVKEKLGF